MRVLIAAGGTGGHIYPAITIARELKERDRRNEILFLGTFHKFWSSVIEREGFNFKAIAGIGWERRLSIKTPGFIYSLLRGFWQSARHIHRFRPDLVLGMGGYSSGPPLILSLIFGLKTMIHEQNILPGMTNRILGRWVDLVTLSFEDEGDYFPSRKVVVTGNPVRGKTTKPKREAISHFGLEEGRFTILIFGGSRGAHSINTAIVESLERLDPIKDKIQMIFSTGREDYNWIRERIEGVEFPIYLRDFIFDMPLAFCAADLVVGRAGAGSIAEITQAGLPGILIPYPYATDDHQFKNAYHLEQKGAAVIILDRELNGKILSEKIMEIVRDLPGLEQMAARAKSLGHPDAAAKIVDLIYELVIGKLPGGEND